MNFLLRNLDIAPNIKICIATIAITLSHRDFWIKKSSDNSDVEI